MRLLTYVFKSINLFNLLLVAAVAVLAVYLLSPLLNMKTAYKPPAVAKQTAAPKEEIPAPVQSPPLSDYMVVAEQNIFHPERKIPPEAKDEKALPKPDIFLYGTLVADNMRLAYIEDKKSPQSTPGRGKRQTVVKQGDVISGFVLKSVEADRIVLTRGEEQMIVYLSDAKKQREVVTAPPPAGQRGGVPGTTPFPAAPGSAPGGAPGTVAMPGVPAAAGQRTSPASVAPGATPQSAPGSASPAATSPPVRQPPVPSRTNPITRQGTVQPQQ
jgi:hypothetical protein